MRARVGSGICAVVAVGAALLAGSPAQADTAPAPGTPATVSADLLPSPQINGVAWAQVVSGTRVYVVGRFTSARPFGAPAGTGEVARSNILAYDYRTGALSNVFAARLNGQGLGLAASPDGTRIYVTGEFTEVNGVPRSRVAALNANTGAVSSTWRPTLNARARPIVARGTTVYVGGAFTVANGVARSRVAAFTNGTGSLTGFAPRADAEVMAMTLPPGGTTRFVLGGRFATVNGTVAPGLAAVDSTTGATLSMPANQIVRNSGLKAAIYSLSSDTNRVYGTGYVSDRTQGNLEGTFAAGANTGRLDWVHDCLGDSYSVFPAGPVVYTVSHAHDCSRIGQFPERSPRTFQRAMAATNTPAASGLTNGAGPFAGRPAAEPLHWLPSLDAGSFTGQTQAAWSVTATSQYVLLGGEFPRVNGRAQQGLARFGVASVAPNKEGPRGDPTLTPTLTPVSRGTVRVGWTATWDRDNRRLSYEVLRGSTVLATLPGDATWWSRPAMAYTDSAAPPGTTQSYRIRVRDAFGNVVANPASSIVVPS